MTKGKGKGLMWKSKNIFDAKRRKNKKNSSNQTKKREIIRLDNYFYLNLPQN